MEGSAETGSTQSSQQPGQSSQSTDAPSSSQSAPVTDNAAEQTQGQATVDNSSIGGQSQAAMPQLDSETQTWLSSKGLSVDTISKDPMKVLQMYRNAESHMSKSINDLKDKYETELKLKTAELAAPIDPASQEEKKPTIRINEKYEGMLSNLLYTLGVNDLNEFMELYPADQYPNIHQNVNKIQRDYNVEFQRALADDVEFLNGGSKKKSEQAAAQEKLQKEWEGVKTSVSTKFATLRQSNPKIDANIKESGVGEIVKGAAGLMGVPEEYLWHDSKMSDFFIKAANAITFMQNAPKLQEEWKQNALKEFEKQKQVESISASDGNNFVKSIRTQKGVSLLE